MVGGLGGEWAGATFPKNALIADGERHWRRLQPEVAEDHDHNHATIRR
jgi:hypothetical protein